MLHTLMGGVLSQDGISSEELAGDSKKKRKK